jgi:hypothetical protein
LTSKAKPKVAPDCGGITGNRGSKSHQPPQQVNLAFGGGGGAKMFASIACVLLLSPFDLIEASIDRAVFPERSDNWDRIGLFKLKDGEKDRLVLLYYYDSDSVSERIMKKEGIAARIYPNSFSVHAVYPDASGKWVHKEVFGYGRVRFTKVAKATPDHLVLECRPNFMIEIERGEDIGKALKRAKEINKPFEKRVSFVDGALTAK